MRQLLLVSSAISVIALGAQPAVARPWLVGQQTIAYTSAHPVKDDLTAPFFASEPADIASGFTESAWEHITGGANSPAVGQFDGPGTGSERKARFDCNVAFENHNDPIIAPGVANGSTHDHTFFGNTGASSNTQNVTYTSLRNSGNSTCYGGPLNRTLYWEPSVKKALSNGAVVTKKPKNIVTYYEGGGINGTDGTRWPRSLEFIEGFNMSDPTNTRLSGVIAAANAASSPGRYTSVAASSGGGFLGWYCSSSTSNQQPYLKDGSGNLTITCAAGSDLYFELLSDGCWDGVNPSSPNGRDHMMPLIRDNFQSKNVCPDNWVKVPQFRSKVAFAQNGPTDWGNWYAASDRMPGMTQFLNGQSVHFDLIPAWSYGTASSPGVMLSFFQNCLGLTINEGGNTLSPNPHECGYGRISSDKSVFHDEASPDASSPNPIVDLSPSQAAYLSYFSGATGNPIPGTIHNVGPVG